MDEKRHALISRWATVLHLTDWTIFDSPIAPTEDDRRSCIDIDNATRDAVLRFDPVLPPDQLERSVLHELLHLRLVAMEDAFNQVAGDDETAQAWHHRAKESAIEALVDAFLPGQPRRNYRGGPEWVSGEIVALGPQ